MGDMTDGQSGSVESVLKRCVWAFRGCELSFYAEVNYGIIKKHELHVELSQKKCQIYVILQFAFLYRCNSFKCATCRLKYSNKTKQKIK